MDQLDYNYDFGVLGFSGLQKLKDQVKPGKTQKPNGHLADAVIPTCQPVLGD